MAEVITGVPLASELTVCATLLALAVTSKLFLIGLPIFIALDMLEQL